MDLVTLPFTGRYGRGDRDPALLFLGHPVHDSFPIMHLSNLVGFTRIVEDPLRYRGLSRINMCDDPDIPNLRESFLLWDCHLPFLRLVDDHLTIWHQRISQEDMPLQ